MDDERFRTADSQFPGEGEMVRAVNEKDWSATLLGPVPGWPASIRTAVSISLNSNFQISVLSSADLVYIYNDATIPIFGDKHPWALGRRVADVWPEAWPTIGPMLTSVLETGKPTRHDDLLLELNRTGFSEECYFTFSYSPIRADARITDGVFVTTMETTRRVLSERRQRTLSELATQVAQRRGDERTLELVRDALAANLYDVPLSALYLAEPGAGFAHEVFCTGLHEGCAGIAKRIAWPGAEDAHPLSRLAPATEPRMYEARALITDLDICGIWPEPPREVLALPFTAPGQERARGFLLVAANPRSPLDAEYRQFLEALGGLVATAVAGVDALAAERRRIEAMAELDRTKSQFFANASHELRTPLTLILGPLAELLEQADSGLEPGVRDFVEQAHRNAQRLQKLVNSIMDFASIEAGRLPMVLEAVDIGALSAEIASLFRSAIEAAGLSLSVSSSLPAGEVLVDRDMWEKVLLNLLSNAYKFTPAGKIELALGAGDGLLRMTVRDTGIGIAADEQARVFERFYRSGRPDGRHIEGSGIGLALVRELVRLHGGNVEVESRSGQGSTFTVTLPWRPAPAGTPRAAPGNASARAEAFLGEFDGLAARARLESLAATAELDRATIRVVVVDDNADVVHYIGRILHDCCVVASAHDAVSGLAAVRALNPDLVLVDVMMPGVDGLELVRQIRADPAVRTVSIIVLSARAGADAGLDALAAGADEYLGKPFSGRDLIARVSSHVRMARIRRCAIEQEVDLKRQIEVVRHDLASVLERTSDAFLSLDRELRVLRLNEAAALDIGAPVREVIGRSLLELVPDLAGSLLERTLRETLAGAPPVTVEQLHSSSGRWFNVRCFPSPEGLIVFANDITERKEAERLLVQAKLELERRVERRTEELRDANQLLAAVFDRAPGGIAITDTNGVFVRANPAYQELVRYSEAELAGRGLADLTEPDDYPRAAGQMGALLDGELGTCQIELRFRRADGSVIWVQNFLSMIDDEARGKRYFVLIAKDITESRRVEDERRAAQVELNELYERLQTVREAERTALAREVHDQLGQTLSAAKIDLKLLEDDIRLHGAALSAPNVIIELQSACATLDRAMQLVRDIATELRAPELDGQGLYAAIEWHARDFERRTRIRIHVDIAAGLAQPARPAAEALLRIFQESITNVLRHAHASNVWVSVEPRAGALLLRVRDDGAGIRRQRARTVHSLGITGMQERAALAGGQLRVGPLTPCGTLVSALIPMHRSPEVAPASLHAGPT